MERACCRRCHVMVCRARAANRTRISRLRTRHVSLNTIMADSLTVMASQCSEFSGNDHDFFIPTIFFQWPDNTAVTHYEGKLTWENAFGRFHFWLPAFLVHWFLVLIISRTINFSSSWRRPTAKIYCSEYGLVWVCDCFQRERIWMASADWRTNVLCKDGRTGQYLSKTVLLQSSVS